MDEKTYSRDARWRTIKATYEIVHGASPQAAGMLASRHLIIERLEKENGRLHAASHSEGAEPATEQLTTQQIEQWISACNHEPAREVLREYLRMKASEGTEPQPGTSASFSPPMLTLTP